jgi:hypothetical protein
MKRLPLERFPLDLSGSQRGFAPMTIRMGASVGPGVCGPSSAPRNRRQSAGQSPFVALKPVERRASTRVDAASTVAGSLPSLMSTTTPKIPATPVHFHVCAAQPASPS